MSNEPIIVVTKKEGEAKLNPIDLDINIHITKPYQSSYATVIAGKQRMKTGETFFGRGMTPCLTHHENSPVYLEEMLEEVRGGTGKEPEQ